MLHTFVAAHREELIDSCLRKGRARSTSRATPTLSRHGVSGFLDELVSALEERSDSRPEMDSSAARHGRHLRAQGFTVSEVVHDYGDVCQAITDLAVETDAPIGVEDFRTLNGCLDDAIASAVTAYVSHGADDRSGTTGGSGGETFGFAVHEIRNLLNTATLAFDVLHTGNVGVRGSTGAVLRRSLLALRDILNREIAEIRLLHADESAAPIGVAELVEEVAAGASLDASRRDLRLSVQPGSSDVVVLGDRQVVASIVHNLLQNALKFTRPGSHVSLCATATVTRVAIEVADECGGLTCEAEELFRPFERHDSDRTGLGLGLPFCRRAAAASGGQITVRNLPDYGCVFALDMPRVLAPTDDDERSLAHLAAVSRAGPRSEASG